MALAIVKGVKWVSPSWVNAYIGLGQHAPTDVWAVQFEFGPVITWVSGPTRIVYNFF